MFQLDQFRSCAHCDRGIIGDRKKCSIFSGLRFIMYSVLRTKGRELAGEGADLQWKSGAIVGGGKMNSRKVIHSCVCSVISIIIFKLPLFILSV